MRKTGFDPLRRRMLKRMAFTLFGTWTAPAWGESLFRGPIPRPHIYWRQKRAGSLRTVADVKRAIVGEGPARRIWLEIEAACKAEFGSAPLTCGSRIPGRAESFARQNNPDYTICHAAGQRILRHAVALHLTGHEEHKRAALDQLEALFDESVWPDWIDQAHLRFGLPADLRTGMLSQDTALAYDWLYPFLDDKERGLIIEGIERRGIRPYLQSMNADPWWAQDLNNWYTVIIGGLGIAGMALGPDHPDSERLIFLSRSRMQRYLSIYGDDGSFNESVAYSKSTRIPVAYYNALFYHAAGLENPLSESPFPETAEWTLYATLPPGRLAAFGDGHADAPVEAAYLAAIAAAIRDPVIQGFALRHIETEPNPYTLLWLDPGLSSASPEGRLPLGRAFHDNSALIFSRSSWDPMAPEMIVYGKAKQAHNHGHNDLGQVCIDLHGQRMITDPGAPSAYPEDFFDESRYRYYNASVRGHNVLMFGGREQRHPPHDRGAKEGFDFSAISGRILHSVFDDELGGCWQIDLTPAYRGVEFVRRSVIHLLPGWVAVLDEAKLPRDEAISLRWHTVLPAEPDADGNFPVVCGGSRLACRVESLSGKRKSLAMHRHAYEPPYHVDRSGVPLVQRNEPYVEMVLEGSHCRILSLFASDPIGGKAGWERSHSGWSWKNGPKAAKVECTDKTLGIVDLQAGRSLQIDL